MLPNGNSSQQMRTCRSKLYPLILSAWWKNWSEWLTHTHSETSDWLCDCVEKCQLDPTMCVSKKLIQRWRAKTSKKTVLRFTSSQVGRWIDFESVAADKWKPPAPGSIVGRGSFVFMRKSMQVEWLSVSVWESSWSKRWNDKQFRPTEICKSNAIKTDKMDLKSGKQSQMQFNCEFMNFNFKRKEIKNAAANANRKSITKKEEMCRKSGKAGAARQSNGRRNRRPVVTITLASDEEWVRNEVQRDGKKWKTMMKRQTKGRNPVNSGQNFLVKILQTNFSHCSGRGCGGGSV